MSIVKPHITSDALLEGGRVNNAASVDHDQVIDDVIALFCGMEEPRLLFEHLPTTVSSQSLLIVLSRRVKWPPSDLDDLIKEIHSESERKAIDKSLARKDQRLARNAAAKFIIGLSDAYLNSTPEDPLKMFNCLYGILDRRGSFGERFRHHAQQLAVQYTWLTAKQRRVVLKFASESWQEDPGAPDFCDQDRAYDDSLLGWEFCDENF